MSGEIKLNFTSKPSFAASYFGGLLWKRRGLRGEENFPRYRAEWENIVLDKSHLAKYYALCSLDARNEAPILYPLTLVFALVMKILSHKKFPFPYPSMLQLRNHIIYHKPINIKDILSIKSEVTGERFVKKGVELNVKSTISVENDCVWENVNAYFFPLRSDKREEASKLPLLSASEDAKVFDEWSLSSGGGWKYARISGDYNGIHYVPFYARIMGFKRDFIQPHRIVTNCIEKLPALNKDKPARLDVAYKGPLYYNNNIIMKTKTTKTGHRFDLYCGDNSRPGICAELQSVGPGSKIS